jgi:hypothetical protein
MVEYKQRRNPTVAAMTRGKEAYLCYVGRNLNTSEFKYQAKYEFVNGKFRHRFYVF